jgi:hypothetical protein
MGGTGAVGVAGVVRLRVDGVAVRGTGRTEQWSQQWDGTRAKWA